MYYAARSLNKQQAVVLLIDGEEYLVWSPDSFHEENPIERAKEYADWCNKQLWERKEQFLNETIVLENERDIERDIERLLSDQ